MNKLDVVAARLRRKCERKMAWLVSKSRRWWYGDRMTVAYFEIGDGIVCLDLITGKEVA